MVRCAIVGQAERKAIVGEEIVLPFPAPREELKFPSQVRGTLIASSLRSIRDRGRETDYIAQLPEAWRDLPLRAIAGAWLPLDAAFAHYRACDALGFSSSDQVQIGREVNDRVQRTLLGTLLRAARGAGVTPWVALLNVNKLTDRNYDGGGCCVTRLGPKDARAELAANPIFAVPYFRNATRGFWQAAAELFCTRSYVNELAHTDSGITLRISWA